MRCPKSSAMSSWMHDEVTNTQLGLVSRRERQSVTPSTRRSSIELS